MGFSELAEVLGIEVPENEGMLVELTREGLWTDAALTIADRLQISVPELCRFLHVSPRTISRHKGERLDPNLSDRLMTIGRVYARSLQVFKTEERAKRFLKGTILSLGNARPLDLLDTTAGAGMVLDLLGRIEHGIHS